MLAVQRPSMGSSKPPNLEMPFGCWSPLHTFWETSADSAADSFDTSGSTFPFPSPTAPAPGPSILDDNESKFLDSFFDGVSSDQFNYDFFSNPPDGSELGLGWEELPPTFMGTTSSFGQQPQPGNHGFSDMSFGNMNSQMHTAPQIPSSTSADVLAAATLLQNGPHARSMSIQDGMFREDIPRPTNGQVRHQSIAQQTPRSQADFQLRLPADEFMRDNFYTDMVFGPQSSSSMRHRGVNQKADIRWGSDAGFASAQGFVPPDHQENVVATERLHIKAVEEAFSLNKGSHAPSSADTTRPPSPIGGPSSHQRTRSIGQKGEQEDMDSRPRKRRKSKYQEDADDDDESPASPTFKPGVKKRKSKKGSEESPESEQASKRRKSAAAAAAKAVRENLTEEQKRENHIKSEQKRRTLIREGFEDLGELVPGLKGGGFSKSAVLIMAADWLEELIHGNGILQHRLDQLGGR
jgi:hypothetical protein